MNERTNTTVNQATYTRVYNLKVKLYTYQGKDGKERGHYVEIGGVMRDESDQHLFMYVEPHITLAEEVIAESPTGQQDFFAGFVDDFCSLRT